MKNCANIKCYNRGSIELYNDNVINSEKNFTHKGNLESNCNIV